MKCGVGDYTHALAGALANQPDMQVAVLTSQSGFGAGREAKFEVFPIMRRWALTELTRVIGTIREWRPDCIHVQYPSLGYRTGWLPSFIPLIGAGMGTPVVQTWHEAYSRRYLPGMLLKAIVPGEVIVVRPEYRKCLIPVSQWLLRRKKFVFIKNASVFRRADITEEEQEALKRRFQKRGQRLVVFLGFIFPEKGVDLLFEICDPAANCIVIAGESKSTPSYDRVIHDLANSERWVQKVTLTGFLPQDQAGALLRVADAVVLPFRAGGGEWNTSIHGAVSQGTFVLTTSTVRNGYDDKRNIYYAKVDDIEEMKRALAQYSGLRKHTQDTDDADKKDWEQIAADHRAVYLRRLSGKAVSPDHASLAR